MVTHVEKMKEVLYRICTEQLAYYEQKAQEGASKEIE